MKIKHGFVSKPPGQVFETQYGEKQMLIVKLDDGSEEKLYVSPGSQQSMVKRDDQVSIIFEEKNGKPIRRLVTEVEPNTSSVPSSKSSYTAPSKSYTPPVVKPTQEVIDELINAHLYVFQLVEKSFVDDYNIRLSVEDTRTIATSIMIKLDRTNADLTGLQPQEVPEQEVLEQEISEQDIPF